MCQCPICLYQRKEITADVCIEYLVEIITELEQKLRQKSMCKEKEG